MKSRDTAAANTLSKMVYPPGDPNDLNQGASAMRTDPATQRRAGEQEPAALRSDLVDLSGLTLDELDRLPPNALAGSLRRILTENAGQPHSYGQTYQSSI
jgi:FXSXX-COOH protein